MNRKSPQKNKLMRKKKSNILMLLLSPIDNDSRVKKEIGLLRQHGHRVFLISLKSKEKSSRSITINRQHKNKYLNVLKLLFKMFSMTLRFSRRVEYIHCNDVYTIPFALWGKIFNPKVKIIYDSHELATKQNGKSTFFRTLAFLIEKIGLKFIHRVVTVSPSISKYLKEKYKILRPLVVLNCPKYLILNNKNDLFRGKFEIPKESKIFLYQGGFSKGRGIEQILEVFQNLNPKKFNVVFMGYGVLKDKIVEYSKKNSNIFFHEAVKPAVLLDYTSSADFGLVTIENICLSYYYCLPNKLFEFLQAELPVIVTNLFELEKFVTEYNVGVVAKEGDTKKLKMAVEEVVSKDYSTYIQNIRNIKKKYSWEETSKKLIEAYNS